MRNFGRIAKMVVRIRSEDFSHYVDEFEIQNLRMSFAVTKSLGWATNSGILKVWNLSQAHRNIIRDYGDEIEFWAGYRDGDNLQLLYVGQTTVVSHSYDYPEIATTFECADGTKFLNEVYGSFSFDAGMPAREVIENIASYLGLKVVLPPSNDLQYRNGFKFSGAVKEMLYKACEYLDLQATIINNLLYVYPLKPTANDPIYSINEATGMVGVPQRFTNQKQFLYRAQFAPLTGYRITSTLKSVIIPGSTISLSSYHLGIANQPYTVEVIKHNGDTFGPEWISNLEVTLIP